MDAVKLLPLPIEPKLSHFSMQVLASYGHVRDLVAKAGSVDPSANFKMTWVVAAAAKPRLDAIKQALKQTGINRLLLATDPDREGEAIAWHLSEVLKVDLASSSMKNNLDNPVPT